MRAYLWMLDNGTAPDQVVLTGDSAGAGLVLSLLLTLKEQKLPLPGGAALLCPGLDLTFEGQQELPSEQPAITIDQLRNFAAAYLGEHPADEGVVNPLGADLSRLPPMLIQAGTGDVLVKDAHRLADQARKHDVDVRLELYPVATHDFHIFWSFLPEAADAVHQAGRFAREVRSGSARARMTN